MQNRIVDQLFAAKRRPDQSGENTVQDSSWGNAVQDRLDRSRRTLEKLIASHPAVGLGVAVSIGILLGWWIKR